MLQSGTAPQRMSLRLLRQRWRIGTIPAPIVSWICSLGQHIGRGLRRPGPEAVLPEVIAISCFLIFLWTGITVGLYREYELALVAAQQSTGNLARAFEESTRRSIGQIDQILLSARAYRAALGDRFNFNEWVRNQTLPDKMIAAIGMADSHGHVFADTIPFTSAVSIADRPHFRAQIDPAHDNLFISHPVRGRVTDQQTIQFTRKLLGPHGEFAGVIVFSLDCAELSRFYETLDLDDGFVALLASDDTILARGPFVPGLIGTRAGNIWQGATDPKTQRDGVSRYRSFHDNHEKITSFRRLPDYPLTVLVGIDVQAAVQPVWLLAKHLVLGGIIVTLAISVIGMFWVGQKRRSVESQRALNITLETISQGIMMVDHHGHAPVINPRALNLLGLPHDAAKTVRDFAAARAIELAERDAALNQRGATLITGNADRAHPDTQFETVRADGAVIEVRTHRLERGGFVQTYTDVSEQRFADARVHFLAHHDTLTGLANRFQLRQRIPELLGRAELPGETERNPVLTAFMIFDLDGFKGVNDALGHGAGDELLIEVARRLKTLVREQDLVARLGGDEFVVLLAGLKDRDAAGALAERILQRMADPMQIGGHQIRIGASLGIAYHPDDGEDGDILLKHADIALYAAKNGGRGTFRVFDAEMVYAVDEFRFLESDLRRALEKQELQVHFQPKYAGDSLSIVGFEALARWWHPTRGDVSPSVFIRIAEQSGLIKRLGRWVIEQACATAATWSPTRAIAVAVNVSLLQLQDDGFPQEIAAILERTGLKASLLELEVTESVMADDHRSVLENLQSLKRTGIRIALDDFGTGYSSLSYLRRFPFDKIKIDKAFVHGQAHDNGVRVILEAIIGMCRNLGLAVVAEGVETKQQLALLREMGCHELQGFLLGQAMPAAAVEETLRGNTGGLSQVDAPGWAVADEFETVM